MFLEVATVSGNTITAGFGVLLSAGFGIGLIVLGLLFNSYIKKFIGLK